MTVSVAASKIITEPSAMLSARCLTKTAAVTVNKKSEQKFFDFEEL